MRRSGNKNAIFLFLIIIATIDASRIFYLPLPKIHSSQYELESSPDVQKSAKPTHEKKSIHHVFLPLSTIERHMYEDDDENTDSEDRQVWSSKIARNHIFDDEPSDVNEWKSNYLTSADDERRPLRKPVFDDDTDEAIDSLSQWNEDQVVDKLWPKDTATARIGHLQSNENTEDVERSKRRNDTLFLVIVGTCSLIGALGLIAAAIFWYKIQKRAEAALDAEYPLYGVTGPGGNGSKIPPSTSASDRKLAQSAQMFHYQQKRQQMIAQEKAQLDVKPIHSDDSDDETPNGGDYTVYECPGLAPTGEMEVRNPLFAEPDLSASSSASSTPHPTTNNHYPQPSTTNPSSSSSPPKEKSLS